MYQEQACYRVHVEASSWSQFSFLPHVGSKELNSGHQICTESLFAGWVISPSHWSNLSCFNVSEWQDAWFIGFLFCSGRVSNQKAGYCQPGYKLRPVEVFLLKFTYTVWASCSQPESAHWVFTEDQGDVSNSPRSFLHTGFSLWTKWIVLTLFLCPQSMMTLILR